MNSQKFENMLNLSLDSTVQERRRSPSLATGYDFSKESWEVIVRYQGDLTLPEEWGIQTTRLLGDYAVLVVPAERIQALSSLPEITYVEMPKRLFFATYEGRLASCIAPLQQNLTSATRNSPFEALLGKGILVACIDSGIDYEHPDFRNEDGTTRLVRYWDQTLSEGTPPAGYNIGTEFTASMLNNILLDNPASNTSFSAPNTSPSAPNTSPSAPNTSPSAPNTSPSAPNTSPSAPNTSPSTTLSFESPTLSPGFDGSDSTFFPDQTETRPLRPTLDSTGHGTAVLGIAAGNGRASNGIYRGVAPESSLIAVKLGSPSSTDFPRTTQLMQALDYVVRYAVSEQIPVAVNLSFGNNYGSHSGDSLLETYINNLSNYGRCVICIGSGNEGSTGLHTSGVLSDEIQTQEFSVGSYQTSLNIQLWKSYPDDFDIYLRHPDGTSIGPIRPDARTTNSTIRSNTASRSQPSNSQFASRYSSASDTTTLASIRSAGGTTRLRLSDTELLIYYGFPSPYTASQEIYFDFLPASGESYLSSGLWQFRLVPKRITDGEYHLWMPGGGSLGNDTRFLTPTPETTLTIPSTAFSALTVGAYDSRTDTYADFSGRGYTRILRTVKPDLVAPGVAITAPKAGSRLSTLPDSNSNGLYASFTGTSFATPFVTGSAALLMEWGILRGNDPFLYGDDCDIIGLNQRKAHKHREFRWFSPNLSMQD